MGRDYIWFMFSKLSYSTAISPRFIGLWNCVRPDDFRQENLLLSFAH